MMSEGRPHRLETTTVDLRSSIHFAHLDGVDRFPQLTPLRGACKGRQPNDNATTCGSRNPNFDVPWHGDLGSRSGFGAHRMPWKYTEYRGSHKNTQQSATITS